jgi:V/A-type H+-transporting ATPase subunit K
MSKARLIRFVVITGGLMLAAGLVFGVAANVALGQEPDEAGPAKAHPDSGPIAVGAAVSIAGGMLGAGYAVGRVGAAALGAVAERPEITGRALLFVAMGEGIAVLGLVGGVLLMGYLKI